MATEQQLANLKPAKKGEVRNPLGNSAPPEVLRIRRLAPIEVAEVMSALLDKNVHELKKILRESISDDGMPIPESEHSGLKVWIAAIAIKAIEKGDFYALNALLDRTIGRVVERLQVTGADGGPIKAVVGVMSTEQIQAEIDRLDKVVDASGGD